MPGQGMRMIAANDLANDLLWYDAVRRMLPRARAGQVEVRFFYWGYAERHADNPVHRHSFYEVCYVAARTGRFYSGGRWHDVGPGDVFIARPGVAHQILSCGREMELYWVAYDWDGVDGARDDLSRLFQCVARSERVVARDDGRLAQIWPGLRSVARPEDAGAEHQVKCLAASVIVGICQLFCPPAQPAAASGATDRESAPIRRAVAYIHENLRSPLSVAAVSGAVNLSERHFCRLFSRRMGCSFVQYVHRVRLETARALLCATRDPVAQIAEAVGLPDVHYFTRLFTRAYGAPPSRYRLLPEQSVCDVRAFGSYL